MNREREREGEREGKRERERGGEKEKGFFAYKDINPIGSGPQPYNLI